MKSKLIGGTLLVIGTSIGGGMLALPVATAQSGFMGALILLFGIWFLMTAGAFLILEVNLWFPENSNLISMVRSTLGRPTEVIAWLCYLLLLYSLIAAYIAGGADVLALFFQYAGLAWQHWVYAIVFILLFGSIVAMGIRSVDICNRLFMFIKFIALASLLLFALPHIHVQKLFHFHPTYLIFSVTVIVTSFGFATIVPSLRTYFHGNVRQLRKIILVGSLIPLFCYIAWIATIFGEVPLYGAHSLMQLVHAHHTTAALTQLLVFILKNPLISALAGVFTGVCVITSFLGVALCLSDFLADGLKLPKKGLSGLYVFLGTFVPPFIIVIVDSNLFIAGLAYAGIFCIILLVLLPALMAWRGRYQLDYVRPYQMWGGKMLLFTLIAVAVAILLHQFYLILSNL